MWQGYQKKLHFGLVYGYLRHFQQYFSYIMWVSFICGSTFWSLTEYNKNLSSQFNSIELLKQNKAMIAVSMNSSRLYIYLFPLKSGCTNGKQFVIYVGRFCIGAVPRGGA